MVQEYAPTNTASDQEKDEFYELLHQVMHDAAPDNDMKIVLGDFNAQIGRDDEGWVNKARVN